MSFPEKIAGKLRRIADDSYLAWALVAVASTVAFSFASLSVNHGGDITRAIRVGQAFFDRPGVAEMVRKVEPTISSPTGFDGQFFFFLAFDPFLTEKVTPNTLDAPALRARRILYSGFSRLLVRHRSDIPLGLLLTQYLALLAIGIATARIARARDLSPFWAFFTVCNISILVALEHMTSETLAVALMLVAWWSRERKHVWPAVVFLALSILTKEPCAALAISLGVWGYMERRPQQGAAYLTALAPFVLWMMFLAWRLGPGEAQDTLKNLTWPLVGAAKSFALEVRTLASGHGEERIPIRMVSRLWFLYGAVAIAVLAVRHRGPVSLFALGAAAIAILLNSGKNVDAYDFLFNFARQLYLLPPAVFLLYCETRSRSLLPLMVGSLALSMWYAVLLLDGKAL